VLLRKRLQLGYDFQDMESYSKM